MGFFKAFMIILLSVIVISFFIFYFAGHKMKYVESSRFLRKAIGSESWMQKLRFWIGKPKDIVPETKVSIYMKALDSNTGEPIEADFLLKKGSTVAKGKLKPNVWEEYEGLYNHTYQLIAWDDDSIGDDYYSNTEGCTPLDDPTYCEVSLNKQGRISMEYIDLEGYNDKLRIQTEDGTVREPLLCIKWKPFGGIISIKTSENELGRNSFPFEIRGSFEVCAGIDTQEAMREPPISQSKLKEEVRNLYSNCTFSFTLSLNNTLDEIDNLFQRCKADTMLSQEAIIEEYRLMYKTGCLAMKETQRDVINSFTALYEQCNTGREVKLMKDIDITLDVYKGIEDYDEITFVLIDHAEYLDGDNLVESYFGANETDIGVPDAELIKRFI